MGFVYEHVKEHITEYPAGSYEFTDALIIPGQEKVVKTVERVSMEEVDAIALKLDILANGRQNEAISAMVAKAFPTIVGTVAWLKKQTNQEFRGMKALGKQLDITWMRPQDIGAAIMSTGGTSSTGLYTGTGDAVFTWLYAQTAGTAIAAIPEQIMKEECACIHLGAIDPIEGGISPVNRIKFTLSTIPGPAQAVALTQTDGSVLPLQEWECPVVVGPESKQKVEVDGYITKEGRFELLTLLVLQAEDVPF